MSSVVKIDPDIMSGAPCFAGTRVPIQNLIDYLEGGDSIEDFLEGFPTVSREQVVAFLEEAKDRVLAAVEKLLLDECVDRRLARSCWALGFYRSASWLGGHQEWRAAGAGRTRI
jgi:uncharacterized protein (DUF433 family)